jgi:hypothetical protein
MSGLFPRKKEVGAMNRTKIFLASLLLSLSASGAVPDTTVPKDGSVIQVVSPNGGEVFYVGDTIHVRWLAVDSALEGHVALIALYTGFYYQDISVAYADSTSWENYPLVIPRSRGYVSENCRIRVRSYSGYINDTSDAPFAIRWPIIDTTFPTNGKLIQVTSPNGGEAYHVGDTMHIRWMAVDSMINGALISLSINNGRGYFHLNDLIISPLDSTWENYPYVIPTVVGSRSAVSESCFVFIMNYGNIMDTSDAPFSIRPQASGILAVSLRALTKDILTVRQRSGAALVITVGASGAHRLEIYGLQGTRVVTMRGQGPVEYSVDRRKMPAGVYVIKLTKGNTRTIRIVAVP